MASGSNKVDAVRDRGAHGGMTNDVDTALFNAARALAAFEPLTALGLVALRDDAPALGLRGVAMAQLGDYDVARSLLRRAVRAFDAADTTGRARCLAALGEVALARRDLTEAETAFAAAETALDACGDRSNTVFVRLQRVRARLLRGEIGAAAELHGALDRAAAPPRIRAMIDLVGADIASRRLDPKTARVSLDRARRAAEAARVPSLEAEVARATHELAAPVARVVRGESSRDVDLSEVATIVASRALVVDGCRRLAREGTHEVSLVTRPVLLALAVELARAHPEAASRESLAVAAFGARRVTESVRARLRVELGRLRRALGELASIEAVATGFVLAPRAKEVTTLVPPREGEESALLALLRGGDSWSTSGLAAATGKSQRTVQRALTVLRDGGRIDVTGRGRTQRWVARPPEGFATTLLLVVREPKR